MMPHKKTNLKQVYPFFQNHNCEICTKSFVFSAEKNPVQEWFETLSKNVTTNTQNAMNNIKDWFTKMAENNQNGVSQSLPTMYMGSFQLLKMPMPQISDVVKGMGDLATAAQTVNKLTGLTG